MTGTDIPLCESVREGSSPDEPEAIRMLWVRVPARVDTGPPGVPVSTSLLYGTRLVPHSAATECGQDPTSLRYEGRSDRHPRPRGGSSATDQQTPPWQLFNRPPDN